MFFTLPMLEDVHKFPSFEWTSQICLPISNQTNLSCGGVNRVMVSIVAFPSSRSGFDSRSTQICQQDVLRPFVLKLLFYYFLILFKQKT